MARGRWTIMTWEILPDWRPAGFRAGPTGFIQARASVGLTLTHRRSLERAAALSGLSMSEVIRRCLAHGGVLAGRTVPPADAHS